MQEAINSFAKEFFTKMEIAFDSLATVTEDEERSIYRIDIQTPDSKLLIGVHGQTLEFLTHLLARMLEKIHGKSILLHLEVNDYLKSKDERLFRYVDSKIQEVMKSGGEIHLSELTSYERKKVHAYIQSKNIPNLRTFSVGEKSDRRMHIAYEKSLLSELEEDGVGI